MPTVKAENAAIFPGHQITPAFAQETGSQFFAGSEGACIKHRLEKSSLKTYDKRGIVFRVETAANGVSCSKPHRKREHRHGLPPRVLPRSGKPSTASTTSMKFSFRVGRQVSCARSLEVEDPVREQNNCKPAD